MWGAIENEDALEVQTYVRGGNFLLEGFDRVYMLEIEIVSSVNVKFREFLKRYYC